MQSIYIHKGINIINTFFFILHIFYNCYSGNMLQLLLFTFRLSTIIKSKNIQNQQDATYYFIALLIGSTCFGHYYAYHQELATMMLITPLVVSFLVKSKAKACSLDTTPA